MDGGTGQYRHNTVLYQRKDYTGKLSRHIERALHIVQPNVSPLHLKICGCGCWVSTLDVEDNRKGLVSIFSLLFIYLCTYLYSGQSSETLAMAHTACEYRQKRGGRDLQICSGPLVTPSYAAVAVFFFVLSGRLPSIYKVLNSTPR